MARLTRLPRLPQLMVCAPLLLAGCGKTGEPDEADVKKSAEDAGEAAPEPEPAQKVPATERLLTYLDPEATAVLYLDVPEDVGHLDVDVISTVFAIPPRGRDLLVAGLGMDEALDATAGPDAPPPHEVFATEALVMIPAVATGPYLLRPLAKTPTETEKLLLEAGMQKAEVDGMTMFAPRGAFPYKVVLLEQDVAAFIPVTEIGSGLGPLTAGRDLPASEVRTELSALVANEPGVFLVQVVAGPMLHLELSDDVALARLILRKWQEGIDAEARMQTTGDPSAAAKELEAVDASLETDQVKALVDRVAWTVDGPTVMGKLQMTKADLDHLRKAK